MHKLYNNKPSLPLNFFPIFYLVVISFCFTKTFAQSKSDIATWEEQAKLNFDQYRLYKALYFYQKLDSIYPNTPLYLYRLGICNLYLNRNEAALNYFNQCLTRDNKYPKDLYYYTARAFHLSHQFDNAIVNYEKYSYYLKQKRTKRNLERILEVTRAIGMCNNGKELVQEPLEIKVFNMGPEINTEFPEYAPVLTAEEETILFTSCRPDSRGGLKDEVDGSYYEDIYTSTRDSKGQWSNAENITQSINTIGQDASVSLTPDGQSLLFYRYENQKLLSSSSGDLYISELQGKLWSEPVKLPESINSNNWESGACLSADGRTLLFSSNREGGLGGTDIYIVKKINEKVWGLPVNIGSKINSIYDEDSPFLHPDGKTLYFSSNGHKTMGGHDIFVSTFDEETKEWSRPVNVGYPISTAQDEFHFFWSADKKRCYFSSIRPEGYGDRDIYYAEMDNESSTIVLKGFIYDSINYAPLKASIKVKDITTGEILGIINSNEATGKYILVVNLNRNYEITIVADNYKLCSEQLDLTKYLSRKEVEKDIFLCPIKSSR